MTEVRKRRRNLKFHGTRLHGRGDSKHGRGSGERGGRGHAGMHKHKWSYATTKDREWMKYGGQRGFSCPNTTKIKIINLYEIETLAKKGKITDKFEFDGKILGTGKLTHKIKITAIYATEKAQKRIKESGSEFIPKIQKVEEKTE